MARYTFQQFQEEYPDDEILPRQADGDQLWRDRNRMPRLKQRASFHPMSKRRAYACQECGHHVYPAPIRSSTSPARR